MSSSKKKYLLLAKHYQGCLGEFGDTSEGMGWPNRRDNLTRFEVMLDLFAKDLNSPKKKIKILDFGCGTSHFYEFLVAKGVTKSIHYTGLDILEESILISKNKYPKNKYICADILKTQKDLGTYDYVIINGVFTQKRNMSQLEMQTFLSKTLETLRPFFSKGLALNTMSKQVDFKRRGAFHVRLDWMANLISEKISRKFIVRHDYGLYENTFYIFKKDQ